MFSHRNVTRSVTYTALSVAILTVCAWISIPFPAMPAFTLQSFGVLLISALLPFSNSIASISIYLLLGILGLPVFSGFTNGAVAFGGISGGFLIGFWLSTLLIGMAVHFLGRKTFVLLPTMLLSVILYNVTGILYMMLQLKIGFIPAFLIGSLPFLVPDTLKVILAIFLCQRFRSHVHYDSKRKDSAL